MRRAGARLPARRTPAPEPRATPAPTSTLPTACAAPYVPVPTSGAVQAAATGMRPEKSVARSAPMRCMPMYQATKPTTVTTTACHSSAAASAAVGVRGPPPVRAATAADSAAAIPHTVADSSRGPRGRSTGTARTANPTSPASAHTDQTMPVPSVRPQPCTVQAPSATSAAPYSTRRSGRRPSVRGTTTATATGAQPTKTPGTAGSAVRSAASTARLKPTMPTAASSASLAHWRGASRRSGAVPSRPTRVSSSAQARP